MKNPKQIQFLFIKRINLKTSSTAVSTFRKIRFFKPISKIFY